MSAFSDALYRSPPPPPAAAPVQAPPPVAAIPPAQAPVTAPADAPAADVTGLTPEIIKAGIPADVLKARSSDPARRLYADTLVDALPDDEFQVEGVAPDAQIALASETRALAQDMSMQPADIDLVRTALRSVQAEPPTDEARVANRESAVEMLNRTYGDQATEVVNLARRFLQDDPRRAALLAPAGDDPKVIARVVELALQARRAGRLR